VDRAIEERCDFIATTPNFGELRPEFGADIRSYTVGRYVIFFRSIEDGIEVVRVVAGDRDIREL
jgi:toxin ParE1/3/4